jgi:hypothetical protein
LQWWHSSITEYDSANSFLFFSMITPVVIFLIPSMLSSNLLFLELR